MSNGLCDVNGCSGATYLGWRPLTERRGRQICEYHWRRHLDEKDGFDLFEAFNFQRPARMLLGLVYDLAGVGHSNQPREAERAARNVLNQPLDAGFIASRQVHRLVDAENSGFPGANLAATAAL